MKRNSALALLALVGLAACGRPAPETAAPPTRVENAALGVRLTQLPEGFAVAVNRDERLVLDAPAGVVLGTASIALRPTASSSVNLVAEARAFGEAAAAAEGGKFFGGNELVTPFGPAYTVRALVDRGMVEERAVYLLHPDGSGRLLVLTLRYPPGDDEATRVRMLQMMELVGAIEAAGAGS